MKALHGLADLQGVGNIAASEKKKKFFKVHEAFFFSMYCMMHIQYEYCFIKIKFSSLKSIFVRIYLNSKVREVTFYRGARGAESVHFIRFGDR